MADCKDVNDQKIAYRGLFDLKDAQIIRAEIVSINSTNNTAEVTLLDECTFDDWLDVTAIPFDYLCEGNEERTVEALAYGYKAFTNGDIVYLLLTPEYNDYPAQAYIIGHVDIRDTKPCSQEYILISRTFSLFGIGYTVSALYDVVAGKLIDLDSFENKTGSPVKPSSAVAYNSSTFNAWFAYNFSTVYSYGATFPTVNADIYDYLTGNQCTLPNWLEFPFLYNPSIGDASTYTPYTGSGFIVTSEGDACSGFNLGNEMSQTVWSNLSYPCSYAANGESGHIIRRERKALSASKSHMQNGDQWCGLYWPYTLSSNNQTTGSRIPGYGFKVVDHVSNETVIVDWWTTEEKENSTISTISGQTYTVDGSFRIATIYSMTCTDSGNPWVETRVFESNIGVNYVGSGSFDPPTDLIGTHNATECSGDYTTSQGWKYLQQHSSYAWDPLGGRCNSVGFTHLMIVFGHVHSYLESANVAAETKPTVTINGVSSAEPYGYLGFPTVANISFDPVFKVTAHPFSLLYRIPLGTDISVPISLSQCMKNADRIASIGMNEAIVALYEKFSDDVIGGDFNKYNEWLMNGGNEGPIFSTYKRS